MGSATAALYASPCCGGVAHVVINVRDCSDGKKREAREHTERRGESETEYQVSHRAVEARAQVTSEIVCWNMERWKSARSTEISNIGNTKLDAYGVKMSVLIIV